jgi:hypothetical protein
VLDGSLQAGARGHRLHMAILRARVSLSIQLWRTGKTAVVQTRSGRGALSHLSTSLGFECSFSFNDNI